MDTLTTLLSPCLTVLYHPWFVTAMWIVGSASVLAYLTLLFFQGTATKVYCNLSTSCQWFSHMSRTNLPRVDLGRVFVGVHLDASLSTRLGLL